MENDRFVDDKKAQNQHVDSRELIYIPCVCGLGVFADLSGGPQQVEWECPDLECRRQYSFEYIGRRREPELRLVRGDA